MLLNPHRNQIFWLLFFLISFGLGYPTLNRYDPRKALPDAAIYAKIATDGPGAVGGHLRFRVLLPFLARIVFLLAKGHTGTWDPLMLGLLVVNAFFVASTSYLLSKVGSARLGDHSVALLGAALYLLNFAIANMQLAALVDSGEAFFLMAIIASMFYGHWAILPFLGALGSITKESFVPFSVVMAISWWITSPHRARPRYAAAWISAMIATEVVALIILQSVVSSYTVWPWSFARSVNSTTGYGMNFLHSLIDRNSSYILVWLLPLGLVRIREFSPSWVAAAGVAALSAFVLNAYHSTVGGGGGGIGRYIFNVAGPLLSLSAASFLSGYKSPVRRDES